MFANAIKSTIWSVSVKSVRGVNVTRTLATYKSSTGLVGLAVDPNGRETLQDLAATVLSSVKKIPEHSEYRKNVEKWFTYIAKVADEKKEILEIENELDLGQIEEVITMGKDELELIDYYYEMKGWDLVAAAQKEADAVAAEQADSVYFSNPENRK